MSWANAIITNKGLALLAKLTQGNTLEITSAKTGAGTVDSSLLQEQTGVTTPKQALTIQSISNVAAGECTLVLSLNNDDVDSSYTVKQIGIFANDPDDGEVLYCITQADSGEGTIIPSAAVMPGYNAEWTFKLKYDQADSVNVTLDPSNSVTQEGMENYVSTAIEAAQQQTITTGGTGAAYTATVPGITALKAGATFVMIPHVVSTTNQPTLNVNGLGAKPIRQPLTTNTGATTAAALDTWLSAGKPVRVTYDGTLWEIDIPRPSATSLYGTVPIESGGTGAKDAVTALINLFSGQSGDTLPEPGIPGRIFLLRVSS